MIELQSEAAPVVTGDQSARVSLPEYDRAALTPSVVHIGVGSFHRAHQAVYFDELAREGNTEWGVVGVGVRSREVADALAAQNNMFTVVERDSHEASARVVGALIDLLVLADEPEAVQSRLADPATRLVTLTITGDGYAVEPEAPGSGTDVFTTLARALDERRRRGLPGFTVLSCDNMPDSGAAARRATLSCAASISPELTAWVEQHVTFPASMVDRITPAIGDEQREWVEEEFAIADLSPVVTESFAQWVIEDDFCNGRPPLDTVGAQFVEDVAPYKLVKSRMLNGTHSALGYLGRLAGHERTDEAMQDAVLADFVDQLMAREIAPLLPGRVPGMRLGAYRQTLLERFANPAIADELDRLCRRGTTKMPSYLLPSLHEARRRGRPRQLLTLVVAAWLRYLRGTALDGSPLEVVDPRQSEIAAAAEMPLEDGTRRLLAMQDVFGDLGADRRFVREVLRLIRLLDSDGVDGAIADLLRPRLAS
jgi:mannitol-1-phosphate/altronate dehydrogenase